MEFKSYTDIENSYNEKVINQIREMELDVNPAIKWCAQTKIDGCNFQCSIDENNNFVVGCRSRFLKNDSNFNNFQTVMEKQDIENKIRLFKERIIHHRNENGIFIPVKFNHDKFSVRVYGELCGGMYRHPDVEKVKGAIKIQGRVSYCPDNAFIVFDAEIVDENNEVIWLFNMLHLEEICKKIGLLFAPILNVGTFDEMLHQKNDDIDIIGNHLFGLPLIENNIMEGIVIKPLFWTRFKNGSRVLIKSKNDKFKEKAKKEPKLPKEIIPMNELELKYFELYREYITESRFLSVISKIDNLSDKSFGLILGNYMKDIYNDFDKEYGEEVKKHEDTLTQEEFNLAKVKKEIAKEVVEFIRPLFVKHI